MKLVVGLGNDGVKYAKTRHNVGFLVIDRLMGLNLPRGVVAVKSEGFINASGIIVARLKNYYKMIMNKNLYIVHDDLDIILGEYKIQFGRGPKDHNGVNDIEEKLANTQFWRVRVGIDGRDPEAKIAGEEYVLQNFDVEELKLLESVIDKAVKDLVERL